MILKPFESWSCVAKFLYLKTPNFVNFVKYIVNLDEPT